MTIAKRLARERDEMCRELRRLHESTLELHDKIILDVQPSANGVHKNHDLIQACNSLHERWHQHNRQFFNTTEASEHKLWIAEESWRKTKNSSAPGNGNGSSGPSSLTDAANLYPQRNLRDRLEAVRGRSLALPTTSGVAALASSEDEDASKEEDILSNDYEDVETRNEIQHKR